MKKLATWCPSGASVGSTEDGIVISRIGLLRDINQWFLFVGHKSASYWAALSLSFRLISIYVMNIIAWVPIPGNVGSFVCNIFSISLLD